MKTPLRLTTAGLEPGTRLRDKIIRKWRLIDNIGWVESAGRCFPTLIEFTDGSTLKCVRVAGWVATN